MTRPGRQSAGWLHNCAVRRCSEMYRTAQQLEERLLRDKKELREAVEQVMPLQSSNCE